MNVLDTICAPITVRGESSVALIRISGHSALSAAQAVFSSKKPLSDYPGYSIVPGYLIDPEGRRLDRCMAFVFRAPHSFTGEDTIELSYHGSSVITDTVSDLLLHNGIRGALPGEFTRRAFMNGKMTLTEAEAVIDIIEARSSVVLDLAEHNNSGDLDKKLTEYSQKLLEIFSQLNLAIDFDEEGLGHTDWEDIKKKLNDIASVLYADLDDSNRALREKRGVSVVITGAPNVGKSTLMNALLGKERVLVSDIPGTTRDYIGDELVLNGHLVRLYDSAGIRDTDDRLESLGIEKAKGIINEADVVIYLYDNNNSLESDVVAAYTKAGCVVIPICNKCDQISEISDENIHISAKTGFNISLVKIKISEAVSSLTMVMRHNGVFMTERQHDYCSRVYAKVTEAVRLCESDKREEIISGVVRAAIEDMDILSGKKVTEAMLESIFSRFCIGK